MYQHEKDILHILHVQLQSTVIFTISTNVTNLVISYKKLKVAPVTLTEVTTLTLIKVNHHFEAHFTSIKVTHQF